MTPNADLLTTEEVAGLLGTSDEAVRGWIRKGTLPAITLPSGRRRVRRSDVDAVLNGTSGAEASA